MVFMVDMYTSYLCILLSFNHFGRSYKKICCLCHSLCDSCWKRCFSTSDAKLHYDKVNSASTDTERSTHELSGINHDQDKCLQINVGTVSQIDQDNF